MRYRRSTLIRHRTNNYRKFPIRDSIISVFMYRKRVCVVLCVCVYNIFFLCKNFFTGACNIYECKNILHGNCNFMCYLSNYTHLSYSLVPNYSGRGGDNFFSPKLIHLLRPVHITTYHTSCRPSYLLCTT